MGASVIRRALFAVESEAGMMLRKITDALNKRSDLAGWTVQHSVRRGAQVYAVKGKTEAQRMAEVEQYRINVLCWTSDAQGNQTVGSGEATILPGDNVESAIETAVLVAGLVSNPVHTLPAPSVLPDVPLVDPALQKDTSAATKTIMERIQASASQNHEDVYLTAAECFGEVQTTRLVNSRGIDAEQEATEIRIEFVLHGRRGDKDVETFTEMRRRRAVDLHLEEEIEKRRRHTLDLFEALSAPVWQGPVVLRDHALATFMDGGVLQTMGSAEAKYANISRWEIGKSIFRGEVHGDPLTAWANRCMPFGIHSSRFDAEGVPAHRLELIRDNELVAFSASQRYADYLKLPATGAFGGIEIAPGTTPSAALLSEPYAEIIQFSWFNPDAITGDFTSEIRLGYLVENGSRKPFRGGQLIGNYLDALADVRWSAETGMFGGYLGPHTARFNSLKIAG
jgi:predicted Zn-dependent protease